VTLSKATYIVKLQKMDELLGEFRLEDIGEGKNADFICCSE